MLERNHNDRFARRVYSAVIVLSAALAGLLLHAGLAIQAVA